MRAGCSSLTPNQQCRSTDSKYSLKHFTMFAEFSILLALVTVNFQFRAVTLNPTFLLCASATFFAFIVEELKQNF